MRRTRLRMSHLLLLGRLLMLMACAEGSSPPTASIHLTSTPSSLSVASPTPAPLRTPPLDCSVKPPPKTLDFTHFGKGSDTHFLGSSPVWIAASFLPNPIHVGTSPTWKIVVEVGPNYLHPVSLRIRDLRTGVLTQWAAGSPPQGVTQTVVWIRGNKILLPQVQRHTTGRRKRDGMNRGCFLCLPKRDVIGLRFRGLKGSGKAALR